MDSELFYKLNFGEVEFKVFPKSYIIINTSLNIMMDRAIQLKMKRENLNHTRLIVA